jgi:hypothetical protein
LLSSEEDESDVLVKGLNCFNILVPAISTLILVM